MKNLSLYDYANEFLSVEQSLLESMNEETGEIDDSALEALKSSELEFKQKAENVGKFIKNMDASVVGIKAAIKSMQAKKKALEGMQERMKSYLLENMENTGITKIECDYFSISIRKNPPSLKIQDEDAISDEFIEIVETKKIDKNAIKKAIKDGDEIEGAHLELSKSISIK